MTPAILLLRPLTQREFCVRSLLRSGLRLVTMDEPGNTLAHAADRFVAIPDVRDEEAVFQAIMDVARIERVEGIITFVDYLLPVLGRANDALGLRGLSEETARLCIDKHGQRLAFARLGLPNPAFETVASVQDLVDFARRVSFPVVVKPRSRTGSIGVSLARDAEEAVEAFAYASDEAGAAGALAEAYLDGQEYGIDVVCSGASPRALVPSAKDFYDGRFFIRRTHWFPAEVDEALGAELAQVAEGAATALGIRDAVVHVQVRQTAQGPVLIEVNARINGGYNADLFERTTGIDLYRVQLDLLRGQVPDLERTRRSAACLQEVLMPPGRLASFRLDAGCPPPERRVVSQAFVRAGAVIQPARNGVETHAVIAAEAPTVAEARAAIAAWDDAIHARSQIVPAP